MATYESSYIDGLTREQFKEHVRKDPEGMKAHFAERRAGMAAPAARTSEDRTFWDNTVDTVRAFLDGPGLDWATELEAKVREWSGQGVPYEQIHGELDARAKQFARDYFPLPQTAKIAGSIIGALALTPLGIAGGMARIAPQIPSILRAGIGAGGVAAAAGAGGTPENRARGAAIGAAVGAPLGMAIQAAGPKVITGPLDYARQKYQTWRGAVGATYTRRCSWTSGSVSWRECKKRRNRPA